MLPQDRGHLRFWAMVPHLAAAACTLLGAMNLLFAFLAVVIPGMVLIGRWSDGRFVRLHALAALVLQFAALAAFLAIFGLGIREQVLGADPTDAAERMEDQSNLVLLADVCITVAWAGLAGTGRTILGQRGDP